MDSLIRSLQNNLITISTKNQNPPSIVPPSHDSPDYSPRLATLAARVLYQNPFPTSSGRSLFIVNYTAFKTVSPDKYDAILPYLVSRLPGEEDLLNSLEYEVILFAGEGIEPGSEGEPDRPDEPIQEISTKPTSSSPLWLWLARAHRALPRIVRKRLMRLYIVHERSSMRVFVEMFSTALSFKFRKKVLHLASLTALAQIVPIENLLIPPTIYLLDRQVSEAIQSPNALSARAFEVVNPLPVDVHLRSRLPRVLRETTQFLLLGTNITTEGIFRVPGSAKYREILREAYDRGQKFIVWREGENILPLPTFPGASPLVESEIDPRDAYGVITAASLIKYWYFTLREPLFPPSCYSYLRDIGSKVTEKEERLQQLALFFSPSSEQSPLTPIAREIICRHLLPLMSIVSNFRDSNKMTPANLAVCIGPGLIRGEDAMEDMAILTMVQPIITLSIDNWQGEYGLRERCGISPEQFLADVMHPDDLEEYEDPEDVKETTSPASHSPQSDKVSVQSRSAQPAAGGKGQNMPPSPMKRKPAPGGISLPGWLSSIGSSPSNNPALTAGDSTTGAFPHTKSPSTKSPVPPTTPISPSSLSVPSPDQPSHRQRGNSVSSVDQPRQRSFLSGFRTKSTKSSDSAEWDRLSQESGHPSRAGGSGARASMVPPGLTTPTKPVRSSVSRPGGLSRSISVNLPPSQRSAMSRKPLPAIVTGHGSQTLNPPSGSPSNPRASNSHTPSPGSPSSIPVGYRRASATATSSPISPPNTGLVWDSSPSHPPDSAGTLQSGLSTTPKPSPTSRSGSIGMKPSYGDLHGLEMVPVSHLPDIHSTSASSHPHRRSRSVTEVANSAWYDPNVAVRRSSAFNQADNKLAGGGATDSPIFALPASMSSAMPDLAASTASATSFSSRSAAAVRGQTRTIMRRMQKQLDSYIEPQRRHPTAPLSGNRNTLMHSSVEESVFASGEGYYGNVRGVNATSIQESPEESPRLSYATPTIPSSRVPPDASLYHSKQTPELVPEGEEEDNEADEEDLDEFQADRWYHDFLREGVGPSDSPGLARSGSGGGRSKLMEEIRRDIAKDMTPESTKSGKRSAPKRKPALRSLSSTYRRIGRNS